MVYVMLSQVRELCGLFLDQPISEDPMKYTLQQNYLTMMAEFDKVTCPALTLDSLDLGSGDQETLQDLFD